MPSRFIGLRVLALALLALALAAPAAAQRRVLYLDHVGPNAHDHPSRVNARAAIAAIGQASGGTFTVDLRTDPTGLDAAALAPYDALVFFTCGDLPVDHPLRPALYAFVANGKGFVGFHSTTDSFYSWPEYGDFIGARFLTHGTDNRPGTIRVEDTNHVAMQGFTNPFTFTEEFYLFRGPSATSIDSFTRRDLHVLMNLDPATPPPARPTAPPPPVPPVQDTDLPLAWTRQHGAGRVFYSAFGHRPETWDDSQFRAHALGAIRWALFDGDNDGLRDDWELSWGVRDYDPSGVHGAAGDPDADGRSNAQEQAAGTHPRGFALRYLAEGATSAFFETRLGVLNPNLTFTSRVQLRYQRDDGSERTARLMLGPLSRATVVAAAEGAFSTLVVSDQPVVVDRTMTWGPGRSGSHAESALTAPAPDWYFAEGATGVMDLFYQVQNPGDSTVTVDARFLRGPGLAPISRQYTVPAHGRLTVQADAIPGLEVAEVAAEFHAAGGAPIIAERAMYLNPSGQDWIGGIAGAGVTAPGTSWFLAEGATGFFNTYVLLANPGSTDARVRVSYLRPQPLAPIVREYDVPAATRVTIGVATVAPELAVATMSIAVASLNAVPVVVERAMWWPSGGWQEGHATLATNGTGTVWAVAEALNGGPDNTRTYLLVASGASATGDSLRVLAVRDGGPPIERIYPDALTPNARLTIDLGEAFPALQGERIGVIVESMGQTSAGAVTPMPIVVERAMYSDANGVVWAAGSNLVATRLR